MSATINSNTNSSQLYQRALKVMPGGNTRTTVYRSPFPNYAAAAHGCHVVDVDGTDRIDFINNYTSLIHGHSHPAITRAVTAQLELGTAVSMPTEVEVRFAELLCSRVPSFEQIRFANSGTEAVMMAIKAARGFTERPKIAKCEGAYHGSYDHAELSMDTPKDLWKDDPISYRFSKGTPQRVLDDVVVIPFNNAPEAIRILSMHAANLACVLIDPMPSRSGLVPATPEFLNALRQFTTEHGILLVFDEVISFRMGYRGAQGELGVAPDLTAIAKIIGGGFPIGAVAGLASVMSVFDPRKGKPAVPHGGTFNANPISMVAGETAMKLMTPAAFDALAALGARARAGLSKAFAAAKIPGQVTGYGSLFRFHMTARPLYDYRSSSSVGSEASDRKAVIDYLYDHGFMLGDTGFGAISTVMTAEEIDALTHAFATALKTLRLASAAD